MRSSLRQCLAFLFLCLALIASAAPAQARITIAFWSKEGGDGFPHAFFTLRGVPEAGGAPVDVSYGFTAKALTPAILMGNVAGRIDITPRDYIEKSNAHFSLEIDDAQYAAVLRLIDEWGEKGDHHYNLNRRNCVHFVAEAARRSGLTVVEEKKLMKKPRSFTQSITRMNAERVVVIDQPGKAYLASLAPVVVAAGH